ncbi:MAG TPA: hypothetical protein VFU98_18115 [Microlunatus sp.]|nr:hypothetical protein [Microlunatus sp.]
MIIVHAIITSVGLTILLIAAAGLIAVAIVGARSARRGAEQRVAESEAVPVWWDHQSAETGPSIQTRAPSIP